MPRVYIRKNTSYYHPVLYTLKTIEKNQNTKFDFTDESNNASLLWDHQHPGSQVIAREFYDELDKELPGLSHKQVFAGEQMIFDSQGRADLLASIFYMINCLQEFAATQEDLDALGRFRYEASYQHKFDSIRQNLVQQYMDTLCSELGLRCHKNPSAFFLSHDIDTLYGSLWQDGFWTLKNIKPAAMLSLIAGEVSRKPHWKNMDKIMRINSAYDVKAVFFWLVAKGRGKNQVGNADYSIQRERKLLKTVREKGFVNGLHKSTADQTLDQELSKEKMLEPYNRYHFLMFLPPEQWPQLSESSVQFDSSLGFAERYGFRNSYAGAFQPFDFRKKQPYNFVEAPLVFMDTTFHRYMKMPVNQVRNAIIDTFEKNPHNGLFSLVWHNNFFTDYKYGGWTQVYKDLLAYISENRIRTFTPAEIVQQARIDW